MNHKVLPVLLFFSLLLVGCGSKKFKKQPIDVIIKEIPSDHVFSIVLNDMDVEGTFFSTYKHQYKVIEETKEGEPEEYVAGWYEVDEKYFDLHANDMGMELASRGADGKLHKSVNPPGYNNYVGNSKYGHWSTNSGGSSFWAFYGQYAFMSSMFNMATYPVRRSYYDTYRRDYYGTGRVYYGPTVSGRSYYGTYSNYSKSGSSSSKWRRNNSVFKQRVLNRTYRSGSRYSGGSSRSFGGGYGK